MQKIASLILDRYDDVDGTLYRFLDASYFPPVDSFIKTAHSFSPDELERLPDETFAIIFEEDGLSLRKYSTADAGNTALSVAYFLTTGVQLSKEAQQVAAENLVRACELYGINVPERLTKVALGLDTLAMGALTVPGAVGEAKANLQATRGAGSQILTPEQIKMRRFQMGGPQ